METLPEQALQLSERIIRWRRDLHQRAEVGLVLPRTCAYVCSVLDELGVAYQLLPDNSGLTALICGEQPGGTVALRADMDAMPLTETTGLLYAAAGGAMHACAHDAHMAMALGAAALLQQRRSQLHGQVKLIFQPGEEGWNGAPLLISQGVLENPHVDAMFGMHAGQLDSTVPYGCFGFRRGQLMASRDSFQITVQGQGGHGAKPAECVDPVVIAAQLILALQTLASRESAGPDSVVLSVCSVQAAGTHNIIPDQVVLSGALRCPREEQRQQFARRISEISEGICSAMRAGCQVDYEFGYPAVVNSRAEAELAQAAAQRLFGAERALWLDAPIMVSEDMSFYLQERPGCFWFFSTPPGPGQSCTHHHPSFCIDDSLLYEGAALLAQVALDSLCCPCYGKR